MADVDHVFTRDELIKDLADFTDSLSDDVKASLAPEVMAKLEDLTQGINQIFDRNDQLNETIANLQKSSEDYKAKIAAYAAEQADRMRQSIEEDQPDDPAQEALDKVEEDE